MSTMSPRRKRARTRRFRWGPVDPRARCRWFALALRIANKCIQEGAGDFLERMKKQGEQKARVPNE